jgi:uncharacterized protein YlzI (FlbEa/FlbD family)
LFVNKKHQSMWKGLLLVTGLALLVGSGCSGSDGSKGDSATGTHTNGGGEQASKADLDPALEKSFKESDAPGVQALINEPTLLFLDEPTLGLDPRGQQELLVLLRSISRDHGVGIILCSHLLSEIEQVCDEVIILRSGEIVVSGSVAKVMHKVKPHTRLNPGGILPLAIGTPTALTALWLGLRGMRRREVEWTPASE